MGYHFILFRLLIQSGPVHYYIIELAKSFCVMSYQIIISTRESKTNVKDMDLLEIKFESSMMIIENFKV